MEFNPIVFKFEEDKNEYSFEENLCFTNVKKLVKTLMRENIKNGNSSLIIKSMNNLPIYDVIQIKINVLDTGTFLVNFDKEKFTQEIREKLIENIKTLKDENEPTPELQKIKINKLINFLNDVEPMFATFRPHGDIVFSFDDFKSFDKTSFMLIYLGNKEKVIQEKPLKEPKEPKVKPVKEPKVKPIKQPKEKKVKPAKPIKEKKLLEKKPEVEISDISDSLIILPLKNVTYTGSPAKPHAVVKYGSKVLKENEDYILISDDVKIGKATAAIEFINTYKNTPQFEVEFEIVESEKISKSPENTKNFAEKWADFKKCFKRPELKPISFKKPDFEFKLFSLDYLFISIFTMLFGFGLYAGIFESLLAESVATFLYILSVVFVGVLYYSFYSATYKRRVERHQELKYWLLLYVALGATLGIVAGYLVTTYAMKVPEDFVLNLGLLLGISIPVTLLLSLISPLVCILINLVNIKLHKKAK